MTFICISAYSGPDGGGGGGGGRTINISLKHRAKNPQM
jgi:hypothetical protein